MKAGWLCGTALALVLSAGQAWAGDLALKRVMLSSGGVAYVEYEAAIDGDAELPLDVPLDQVDDVLKSIVVFDDKGGVGSASLPGKEPLQQSFRDLPFDQAALNSPADLLNALQGAEIKVGGNKPLSGKILRVVGETVTTGPGASTTQHRVTLLTGAGLQQFVLEEADSVSFADAKLQDAVNKALTEIAANRAKDRRRLVLSAHGSGKRTLRVGYVVGAPLWKASFRMVLPEDQKATKAHLQGWAVLENMSGQDWQGIELTLLSGNPVSFRQAIYQTYYVARPEVPVDVVGHILPQKDISQAEFRGGLALDKDRKVPGRGLAEPFNAPAPAAAFAGKPLPPEPPQIAQSVNTAEASESATQIAFRVPVPVTVQSGHSSMIPIVDRDVPVERLGLYQQATLATHPLASLRLKNDSANGLPPGVMTLYERGSAATSYIGDAQLASLPAGDSRLISYAADEKTQISVKEDDSNAVSHASISEGVLKLTRLYRETITYHVKAPSAEARHLLIERDKVEGWHLTGGKTAEETPKAYRFPLDLDSGKSTDLTVTFEQPQEETEAIVNFNTERVGALAQDRELDPKTRAAFADLAKLRQAVAAKQAALGQLDQQINALGTDQGRIRQNLSSADRDSDLHKRYMTKLSEQETQIEQLQTARASADDERKAAEKAVGDYLAKLEL